MPLLDLVTRTFTVPQTTVAGPASDGASAAIGISDFDVNAYVLLIYSAGATGTYKVQVSNDGTNWFDIGADVTATVNRALSARYQQVRVKCTVNVAGGTVTGTVSAAKAVAA